MKFCIKCKLTKPLGEFNINRTKKDGFQNHCRKCQGKYGKNYRRKLTNEHGKILLIDIETAYAHGRFWHPFKPVILHDNITKPWFIICWAAKWLNYDGVMSDCVTSNEAIERDDFRICESIWELINDASVMVAHNLNKFDKRKLYARFAQNKLPKPRDTRVVDTLTQAQKHFAFLFHKLDYLNSIFSLRMKDKTDNQLWIDCEEGVQEGLDYMLEYNRSDIYALEDLYLEIRPWMTSHPNLAIFVDEAVEMCPHCESHVEKDGYYTTDVSKFQQYRCVGCGAVPRGRKNLLSKEKRDSLLISTAR